MHHEIVNHLNPPTDPHRSRDDRTPTALPLAGTDPLETEPTLELDDETTVRADHKCGPRLVFDEEQRSSRAV